MIVPSYRTQRSASTPSPSTSSTSPPLLSQQLRQHTNEQNQNQNQNQNHPHHIKPTTAEGMSRQLSHSGENNSNNNANNKSPQINTYMALRSPLVSSFNSSASTTTTTTTTTNTNTTNTATNANTGTGNGAICSPKISNKISSPPLPLVNGKQKSNPHHHHHNNNNRNQNDGNGNGVLVASPTLAFGLERHVLPPHSLELANSTLSQTQQPQPQQSQPQPQTQSPQQQQQSPSLMSELRNSRFRLSFKDQALEKQYWHGYHESRKILRRRFLWMWSVVMLIYFIYLVVDPPQEFQLGETTINPLAQKSATNSISTSIFTNNKLQAHKSNSNQKKYLAIFCAVCWLPLPLLAVSTHFNRYYARLFGWLSTISLLSQLTHALLLALITTPLSGNFSISFSYLSALIVSLACAIKFDFYVLCVGGGAILVWLLAYTPHAPNGIFEGVISTCVFLLGTVTFVIVQYTAEIQSRNEFCVKLSLALDQQNVLEVIGSMLPPHIASSLMRFGDATRIPDEIYDDAVLLFIEVQGLNQMLECIPPERFIIALNNIIATMDMIAAEHDVMKVEAIESVYVAAVLCAPRYLDRPTPPPNEMEKDRMERQYRVIQLSRMALAIREASQQWAYDDGFGNATLLGVRMGMACGPVAAGVIGSHKFTYQLFGDTMNMASRMQTLCPPGAIRVTRHVFERLNAANMFDLGDEEIIQVKGKGAMATYFLHGLRNAAARDLSASKQAEPMHLLHQQDMARADPNVADQMQAANLVVNLYTKLNANVGKEEKTTKQGRQTMLLFEQRQVERGDNIRRSALDRLVGNLSMLAARSSGTSKSLDIRDSLGDGENGVAGLVQQAARHRKKSNTKPYNTLQNNPNAPTTRTPPQQPTRHLRHLFGRSGTDSSADTALTGPSAVESPKYSHALAQYIQISQTMRSALAMKLTVDVFERNAAYVSRVPMHHITLSFNMRSLDGKLKRRASTPTNAIAAALAREDDEQQRKATVARLSWWLRCAGEFAASCVGLSPLFSAQERVVFSKSDLLREEMDQEAREQALRQAIPTIDVLSPRSTQKRQSNAQRVLERKLSVFVRNTKDSSRLKHRMSRKGDMSPIAVGTTKIDPMHEVFFVQLRYFTGLRVLRPVIVLFVVAYLAITMPFAEGSASEVAAYVCVRLIYVLWSALVFVVLDRQFGILYAQFIVPLHIVVTCLWAGGLVVAAGGWEWLLSDVVFLAVAMGPCGLAPLTMGIRYLPLATGSFVTFIVWVGVSAVEVEVDGSQLWPRFLGAFAVLAAVVAHARRQELYARRHYVVMQCIQSEGLRMERVLKEMVPPDFAYNLTHTGVLARLEVLKSYTRMTVLYSDIKGFTAFSAKRQPHEILSVLRMLFRQFDRKLMARGVFKLDTIGDAYVCMSLRPEAVCEMAQDMLQVLEGFEAQHGFGLRMRIGIATGPLFAGIVGTSRFRYHAWGLVVREAYKIQENSLPGRVSLDKITCELVLPSFSCELWEEQPTSNNSVADHMPVPLLSVVGDDDDGDDDNHGLAGSTANGDNASPRGLDVAGSDVDTTAAVGEDNASTIASASDLFDRQDTNLTVGGTDQSANVIPDTVNSAVEDADGVLQVHENIDTNDIGDDDANKTKTKANDDNDDNNNNSDFQNSNSTSNVDAIDNIDDVDGDGVVRDQSHSSDGASAVLVKHASPDYASTVVELHFDSLQTMPTPHSIHSEPIPRNIGNLSNDQPPPQPAQPKMHSVSFKVNRSTKPPPFMQVRSVEAEGQMFTVSELHPESQPTTQFENLAFPPARFLLGRPRLIDTDDFLPIVIAVKHEASSRPRAK